MHICRCLLAFLLCFAECCWEYRCEVLSPPEPGKRTPWTSGSTGVQSSGEILERTWQVLLRVWWDRIRHRTLALAEGWLGLSAELECCSGRGLGLQSSWAETSNGSVGSETTCLGCAFPAGRGCSCATGRKHRLRVSMRHASGQRWWAEPHSAPWKGCACAQTGKRT